MIIFIARCLTGLEMGIWHRPYVLFLCPFRIILLPLRIFISFLYDMATQSSSHSWHKEISEALSKTSKMCAFLNGRLDRLLGGSCLFLSYSSSCCLEIELLELPWCFNICKYCRVFSFQYLFDAPLSDFAIIVLCCVGSTIELDGLISSTLFLLAGINLT